MGKQYSIATQLKMNTTMKNIDTLESPSSVL